MAAMVASGDPAPAPSPSGRAGPITCMAAGIRARDRAQAATRAAHWLQPMGMAARAEALRPTVKTRASTPKAPVRESRITSSRRSRPPRAPSPSARSASPSSCSAPVASTRARTASMAAGKGGSTLAAAQAMAAAPRPRPIPTRGKARMDRARSPMPASGSGRRVRNTAARWASPSQDRGGGFSSMTGDSFMVMVYRTAKAKPQYLGGKILEFVYF
ncbi:conserved protein of unknown function （phosphoribosyltransferase fragment) [Magnetospirillum sp. XM-1]|nr:conserved protein of unknown function \